MAFLMMFFEIILSLVCGLLDRLLGRWWFVGSPSCRDMPGKELSSSVRELHVPEGQVDMEIIFFHGLDFGERRDADCRAWMSAEGHECWPQKWLPEKFPGARILAVSYDASVLRNRTRGRMDVELIAENLVTELIECNDVAAGQGLHCPLVLVGHSVGGFVVNQLCRHAFHKLNACKGALRDELKQKRLETFLRNLRGIYYYSTPHGGSSVAKFAPWYKRRGSIMEIMEIGSTKAGPLHLEFKGIRQRYKDAWKLAGVVESQETKLPGFRGVVVEMNSARFGDDFGEHFTLSEDHFSISRPKNRTTLAYQLLVKFLTDIQDQDKLEDIESISYGQDLLVGVESRVQKIKTIIKTMPKIGLYGMAGVGKTTLAKAVLDSCRLEFDFSCWIWDLKKLVQQNEGPSLKDCILKELFKLGKKVSKEDINWDTLKGKSVLLVIDNVDCEEQLKLCQIPFSIWAGEKIRVIVTSRNKCFCKRFGKAFKVKFLSTQESQKLFLHHSFGKEKPPPHVMSENLEKVLKYCGGVPLAIEVIGRTLHKEVNEEIWKATIQKLEEGEPVDGNRDERLLVSLRISYDRLCDGEQKMFLDSALLLMDEPLSKALKIWKASWGCGVTKSWKNLISSCLVDGKRWGVDDEKRVWVHDEKRVWVHDEKRVWVHDALRMLAQNIACPKHDGSHMHNWHAVVNAPQVMELIESAQEPCKAEGLVYEPNRSNQLPPWGLQSERITATRFPHLRLLTLVNVQILGDVVHFPSGLVYLRWSDAMATRIPFLLRHLTKLCWLDLRDCEALENIPEEEVDSLTALIGLELGGCRALTTLPGRIGNLVALVYLGAENSGLREIPDSLGKLTNLEMLILQNSQVSKLPKSLGKLTKLRVVEANGIPLVKLPSSIVNCESLSRLELRGTSVSSLPRSFGTMRNLYLLNLSRTRVETLPESFTELGELRYLWLNSTPLRRLPESFGSMKNMKQLYLSHTRVEELPTTFARLENLSQLYWDGCKRSCLPDELETRTSSGDLGPIRGDEQVILNNLPRALRELNVDYRDGLFHIDGSAANAVVQGEIAPGTPSISASERTSQGGESSDRAEGEGEGHLPRGPAIGAPHASACYLFERLEWFEVQGNANLTEFPQLLLHALSRMRALQTLTLREFHAIRRLPEDFGDFLPNSLRVLTLDGWRILEELPESLGRVNERYNLTLRHLDKLKRLPETIAKRIRVYDCENVGSWPARAIERSVRVVEMNPWALLRELVEHYGHLPHLWVTFVPKREEWGRVEEAVESWNSRHTGQEGQRLHLRKFYEGEQVREMVEVLATVCGGDSGGAQHSGPSAPPAFQLSVWPPIDL